MNELNQHLEIPAHIQAILDAACSQSAMDKITLKMACKNGEIIAEIHSYNANIRIGIIQTIPPAISQNGTGNLLNSAEYSLEYYVKKGLVTWWKELITYDSDAARSQRIYLLCATAIIDRVNNFPKDAAGNYNNDVHPDLSGYREIATAYIGAIKNFM